jgi:hypothetical protein
LVLGTDTFSCLTFKNLNLTPKGGNSGVDLQTDGDVQRRDLKHLEGRELQGVSSAWLDPQNATSIESGSMGNWNQFEANNRLFNVKNTFDENIYTKRLDMTKMSKQQIAKAERIAKEIEGSTSGNVHLQEERGHQIDSGLDEEDLYSGVMREDTAHGIPRRDSGNFLNQKKGGGRGSGGQASFPREQAQGGQYQGQVEEGGSWRRGVNLQKHLKEQILTLRHKDKDQVPAPAELLVRRINRM